MNEKQLLWNRYALNIDLYQKYLDFALKINLFYYGFTGALLSFYFTRNGNIPLVEYSLLLPILFSIALIIFFIYANNALVVSRTEINELVAELKMPYYVRIDTLLYLVRGSVVFIGITLLGIIYVLCSKSL